jgi:hypothetical protein
MIDKVCKILASFVLQEYRLPVVCMSRTDIDEPRQPEVLAVANPPETVSRKYFEQAFVASAQEARPEA